MSSGETLIGDIVLLLGDQPSQGLVFQEVEGEVNHVAFDLFLLGVVQLQLAVGSDRLDLFVGGHLIIRITPKD